MKANLWLGLILLLLTFSCKKQSNDNYTRDSAGYYYKLLAIGDGKLSPQVDGALLCTIELCTQADSVFFNSSYTSPNGFLIALALQETAAGKGYLAHLNEGDSISMLVRKELFFRSYFDTVVPLFYGRDSLVKMNLKVLKLLTGDEYRHVANTNQPVASEDRELQELKLIDEYLRQHHPQVKADNFGLYTLGHHKTNGAKVSGGKKIRVSYQGFYLNGNPIDNGSQQLEFTFGTPDQLVKGLNIVIGNLKKGETTKIIVPSRLAFGELGSSNGSVPPYTPLVYNIKLIDIK